MSESNQIILGSTGVQVGRLGLVASYSSPAEAFEKEFEKGFSENTKL